MRELTAVEHVESAANPFVVPEGPDEPSALRFVRDGDPASGGFATVVTFEEDITGEEEEAATAGRRRSSTGWSRRHGATASSVVACGPSSTASSTRSRRTGSAARASPCR